MIRRQFDNAVERIEGLIKEGIWSAPFKVLAAVSGGVDSMCMAELFRLSGLSVEFSIAHCNFNLRADESDGDRDFVAAWAAGHGIPFYEKSFDTEAYASSKGLSIEMAARELRYSWFAELADSEDFDAVAVAHNANDNAETLLLNIVRGTGLKGLCGMSPVSDIPYGVGKAVLIRPMLDFTRKQIEGFAFANGLEYRTDSTNLSSDYKRNKIRNEVFPLLESLNPSLVRTLNHEIRYFSDAASIVGDYCKSSTGQIDSKSISLDSLMSDPHWRYLLYHLLEPYGFNSATLSSVESLLMSDRTLSGKTFESPTHVLRTGRGVLNISPRSSYVPGGAEDIMVLRGAGVYYFNGRTFKVSVEPWEAGMSLKQPRGRLIMDASKAGFPLVLRRWMPGDWFRPLGLRGKKKVSDFFTDLKYDSLQKDSSVVLRKCAVEETPEQSSHILAVLGERIDDSCKVTSATTSILVIE